MDDDRDLRAVLHQHLAVGFDVLQAADGDSCIELAATRRPDVILLDIRMAGMDGRAVLTRLTSDPRTEDIPVIFLSALTSIEDRVTGLESGAVDYINKPAEPRELRARVAAAARLRARTERLRARQGIDALTGLPDRTAFKARLAEEVARSRRSASAVSIALIEIDDMTLLNTRLGRAGGDEFLQGLGSGMRTALRASDALFRYGGDEFGVIFPDSSVATAYLAVERLRRSVTIPGLDPAPTLSVGIAEYSVGRTAEELSAKAEIALFRAKESGGDRSWRADDPRRHGLNPVALSEELTDREWDVLAHMARKRTEPEIARQLGITTGTVRSHKARIRRKLHVAPDVRLGEFVNANLRELVDRLARIERRSESA